jgi:hypothetical protein
LADGRERWALDGVAKVCAAQGGAWHPSGFPTFLQPTCDGLQLIVWNDAMTTRLSST